MATTPTEAPITGGAINRQTGAITFARPPRVPTTWLQSIGRKPIELVVRVVAQVRKREHNNAYWHFVITPWAAESGDTKQGVHDALKLEILGMEPAEGKRLPRVRSTRGMSPEDFGAFVEQAMAIGARMGVVFDFPRGRPQRWYPPEAA